MLFGKRKIGHWFVGSVSVLTGVMLIAIVWTGYQVSTRAMVDNTSAYQEQILDEMAGKLNSQFKAIESVSLAVSRNNDLMEAYFASGDAYLDLERMNGLKSTFLNMIFSMPIIESIQIYWDSPQAHVDRDAIQFLPLEQLRLEPLLSQLGQVETMWIGERTLPSAIGGEAQVLGFARKLYDKANHYRGVAIVNIKAAHVRDMMRPQEASPTALIDTLGRVLLAAGDSQVYNWSALLERIRQEAPEGRRYFEGRSPEFGKRSLVVWSDTVSPDWMLVQTTPWSRITASGERLALVLLLTGLGLIVLAVLGIVLLNRQFTRPIHALLDEMNSYPEPSASSHAVYRAYENEFGQLFRGYSRMIERVEELYESLEKQYDQRRIAEIKALQAMINPHFLYNTLDQINWMAIAAGQEKISHVLELTGKMLRLGLSNGESLIPLRDELEQVRCYLDIQVLLRGGIQYSFADPERLADQPVRVPKMILQPFVENSIKHGLHGRASGEIIIALHSADGRLGIEILDDGAGFSETPERFVPKARGGYGIFNVRERLDVFFGGAYRLQIQNRMAGGTRVSLELPLLYEEAKADVERSHRR